MCLAILVFRQGKVYLAFNRDQSSTRKTVYASECEPSDLIYSRDQVSLGSWYCINPANGLLVVLTNLDLDPPPADRYKSRGKLVLALGRCSSVQKALELASSQFLNNHYFGTNLIIGNIRKQAFYYCNSVRPQPVALIAGQVYSMSNDVLERPFAKCLRAAERIGPLVADLPSHSVFLEGAMKIMRDETVLDKENPESSIWVPKYFHQKCGHWQTKSSLFVSVGEDSLQLTEVVYDQEQGTSKTLATVECGVGHK